jgi:hypothetical protein
MQDAQQAQAAPRRGARGSRRRTALTEEDEVETRPSSISASPSAYARTISWETPARPPALARFRSGQRVRHQQFGEGIIVESKISSGEEEVIVVFDTVGVKRLIASLAKLDMLRG